MSTTIIANNKLHKNPEKASSVVLPPPVGAAVQNITKSITDGVKNILNNPDKLAKTALGVAVVSGVVQGLKENAKSDKNVEEAKAKQVEAERKLAEEKAALQSAMRQLEIEKLRTNDPLTSDKLEQIRMASSSNSNAILMF